MRLGVPRLMCESLVEQKELEVGRGVMAGARKRVELSLQSIVRLRNSPESEKSEPEPGFPGCYGNLF